MRVLGASAVLLLAAASAARAEPLSVCAENKTDFVAQIRVRALSEDGEFGHQLSEFHVEARTVECREWPEPLAVFGVTARLLNAPVGTRSLPNGEWVCFQDSTEAVLDRLVWALVYDHRAHGYEFGCANTHRIEENIVVFDHAP